MATSCIKNMTDHTKLATHDITAKELSRANRTLSVPFQLTLKEKEGESILICEEVIRSIPKKRLVVFATWNHKKVVAKIFFEKGASKRHLKRDLAGIESLVKLNTPTPKVLYYGHAKQSRIQVIIFERIFDANDLNTLWQEKTSLDDLTELMHAVTIELATQHVLGIIQNDLHLKNFLIKGHHIYTLDGGDITFVNEILSKERSLEHLALFFSQLGVGTEKLQDDLFKTYIHARGWIIKPQDVALLHDATQHWTSKRWERYQKKIHRNCSSFSRMKTFGGLTIYNRQYDSPNLTKFLANPEEFFQHPDTQLLKNGRSSTVAKIKIDNTSFVVKRYNIKNGWHWLRRCMRSTRAAASWDLAHRLQLFGVPTAKPVAFIENRFLGLRGKSYFLMEYIDGQNIGDYFANYQAENTLYTNIAIRVINLLSNLAKLRLTHGDLKSSNIIIQNQRPVIIDLDGMTEYHSSRQLKRSFHKEWQRFMKNWDNRPTVKALFDKLFMA